MTLSFVARKTVSTLMALGLAMAAACDDGAPPPDEDAGVGPEPDVVVDDSGRLRLVVGETRRGFVDGVGREARFEGVTCMELADDGATLYAADTFNGTLRAIDTATGEVTTVAGEARSFSSNDGEGTAARFISPRGIGLDAGGVLYIADGSALRSFDTTSGEVTTWTGVPGEAGSDDGDSLTARLGYLNHDLSVDGDGRVWLADRTNDRLRVYTPDDQMLTTVVTGLDGPGGLSYADGQLYFANTFNGSVHAVDTANDAVVDVASGLTSPQGLAFDPTGQMLYAAGFDGTLQRVTLDGVVTQVLGVANSEVTVDGDAQQTRLGGAFAAPVIDDASRTLYYADLSAESIRAISLDDFSTTTLAGPVAPYSVQDGTFASARFGAVYAIGHAPSRNLVVIPDGGQGGLRLLNLDTEEVTTVTDAAWSFPAAIAMDDDRGIAYVGDADSGVLSTYNLDDGTVEVLPSSSFGGIWGLALDPQSADVVVADYDNQAVWRVDAMGTVTPVVDSGTITSPAAVAVADDGTVFVSDMESHLVWRVDENGAAPVAGDATAGHADGVGGRLNMPVGLAVHDGVLFIADGANHVLRAFNVDTEELSTVLGRPDVDANIGPGAGVPVDDATLVQPETLQVVGDELWISTGGAVVAAPLAHLLDVAQGN